MRVTLTIAAGGGPPGDPERDLGRWLSEREQLRGRVSVVEQRSQPGALSDSVVTVIANLSSASVGAFASALIAWIRHRTTDTRVTVRRADGTRWEISARRVRALNASEVTALVDQVGRLVGEPSAEEPQASRGE